MQYPTEETMPAQYWWVLVIAGILSILFGLAVLLWPGATLLVLIWLSGAYFLLDGAIEIVGMARAIGARTTWWTHLVLGLLSLGAGVLVFAYPGMTALIFLYIVAFWAITIGLIEIVSSFTTGQFLLAVVGLLTVLFGFILLANPAAGILAFTVIVGVFAIVRGVLLLVQAVRLPAAAPAG